MRIIDKNGIEITSPDLSAGKLVEEEILIASHDAVKAVDEEWHYEIVKEYTNGGKDVKKVIDVEAVESKEAWVETEKVYRYVLYTAAELAAKALEENRRPLSIIDVIKMLLPQQVNTIDVDDNTAIRMKGFYPEWSANSVYNIGFKVQYNDKLWRVVQAHTSQDGWEPENVPAIFEQINETHAGTMTDPIPCDGNMALVNGSYYYQDGKLYICTRDTVNPVYHALSELINLYVEEA